MQVPHDGLTQKLQRLSQSQQSIESVSSFCIFYHKDARGVVAVWDDQFYKASAERRLALLYLANHILQEGRKKGPAFQEEFYRVLPKALAHIGQHGDDKARKAVARLVAVWEERRVFGSRHVKSWREVCGALTASDDGGSGAAAAKGGSSSKHAGGGSSKHTASGSGSSKQGAAAAAAAAAAVAATAAGLGPVGEALQKVKQCAAAAAASNKEFSSSWSQATLDTAGLSEVTTAKSKLSAHTAALEEEVAARRAALAALAAETSKQTAELARVEGQLASAGGQQQQLDRQLDVLTQKMATAVASLGQLMKQNGGTPQVPSSSPPAAGGTPEAPELELEDSEAEDAVGAPQSLQAPAVPPVGALNGDLGGFLQQLQAQQQGLEQDHQQLLEEKKQLLEEEQQQLQERAQQLLQQQLQSQPMILEQQSLPMVMQQPQLGILDLPAQGGLPDSLQALLGNPDMLSAAILSGQPGGADESEDDDGLMDLGAFSGPVDQSHSAFADEVDDAYDPLEE